MTQQQNKQRLFNLLLAMLVALPMMSTDMLVPALPIIVEQLGTTPSLVKLTLIAYMAGFSLSILILGIASDKYGRKPCVVIATGIYSLATLGCMFSDSIELLISFRFLQALGIGSCTVLVRAIIRDRCEEKEAIALLALIAASMTLSTILSPVIGGFIVEFYNWRAIFIILLVLASSLGLTAYFCLSESNLHKEPQALNLDVLKYRLRLCFTNRRFIGYTLTISLVWSAFFTFIVESSFIYQMSLNYNVEEFSLVFAFISSGYIAGTLLTRFWVKSIGADHLIALGLYISIASLAVASSAYLFSALSAAITLGAFCFLFACGLIVPNCQGKALQPFPEMAGFAGSAFYFTEMLFAGVVSMLLHKIEFSVVQIMYAMLSIVLIAAICFKLLCGSKYSKKQNMDYQRVLLTDKTG